MSSESSKDINLRGTNPNPTTTTIKVKVQYKELCLMHYQWRTEGVVWGGSNPPPRNSEDIGGVLDRMSKKNRRLDFLL